MANGSNLTAALTRLRARFKRMRLLWREAAGQEPLPDGGFVMDPRGIRDGVWYDMPPLLPGYMRRNMDGPQVQAFLKEVDARQSFRFQFDTPQRTEWDAAIMPVADDPLCEWNEATREQVLSNCHAAEQRHPLAKAAIDYTVGFVIGDGFNLSCYNPAIEALLSDFIEENQLYALEKEWIKDLQVDGEIVARLESGPLTTEIVPLRPWDLIEIEQQGKRNTSFKFRFRDEYGNQSGSEEAYPADEILFVAINKHSYEQRGRPELFVVLPWLRAWREWLEDRARQNYWRNALLWWVKVIASTPTAVAAVLNRWRKPPTPGSVYVSSDKEEVSAVQNNVGAGDASEDGRQMKLAIAAGFRLPEYFFADGANANLASTSSQELPALTKFEDFQQIMVRRVLTPMFRRVIQAEVDAERLAEELDKIDTDGQPVTDAMGQPVRVRAVKAFDVSYEPLKSTDPVNAAQAITLDIRNELVSRQTASTERGYDWQREQRLMAMEEQAMAQAVNAGTLPQTPTFRPEGLPALEPTLGGRVQAGRGAPSNLDTTAGLNGAQINAVLDVLDSLTQGTTAPGVAAELLVAVGISADRAQRMVDETLRIRDEVNAKREANKPPATKAAERGTPGADAAVNEPRHQTGNEYRKQRGGS